MYDNYICSKMILYIKEVNFVGNRSAISTSVIKRLPRYYRFLDELGKNGMIRISSNELSRRMGFTASQIRQDLNCFGGFGQQGYGYNIQQLKFEIGKILGIDNLKNAIIIGAGNMGRTLATNIDFKTRGFKIVGVFDKKQSLIGQLVNGIPIYDISRIDDFCREMRPDMAVLCIPQEIAKDIATSLINLGIKGFWNFSHYDLSLDFPDVAIENVHMGDSLMTLCYNISNN